MSRCEQSDAPPYLVHAELELKQTETRDAGVALPCRVHYRIDISYPPHDALDRLIQLGALDVELLSDGIAAIIPDGVTPDDVAGVLGMASVVVSSAVGRDNGSVWLLSPRAVRIGSVLIAPPEVAAPT